MQNDEFLRNIFLEGLEACSPAYSVKKFISFKKGVLQIGDQEIDIDDHPVYVFAVGKASVTMFTALAEILDEKLSGSLVISTEENINTNIRADEIIAGAHPYPDEGSIEAGKVANDFFSRIPANAILLTLISGGTSSLMCLPPQNVSVDDIAELYRLLTDSGASIRQINTVRKHCSQIKGGQLLRFLDPDVTLIDLVISDVPGDDLSIIGSGPTVEDDSTFKDARNILERYNLWSKSPESVRQHIISGINDKVPETVHPGEDPIDNHKSHIISSPISLAEYIAEQASEEDIKVILSDKPYDDNVKEVADHIIDKVLLDQNAEDENVPRLFIFYGESTVNVTGNGRGGRNQDLALRLALLLQNRKNVTVLCADTDGIDGPTDAAGAIISTNKFKEAEESSLDPESYLARNDAYHFHEQMGTLLKTGPTGNNLMDIVLLLKHK